MNRMKIQQAGASFPEESLEGGVTAMLLKIADSSETAAEIIAQDLEIKKMNIHAAAEHLKGYARKHKNGSSYYMTPQTAEKLLRDFYKIPEDAAAPVSEEKKSVKESPAAKKQPSEIVDLMDLI